MPVDVRICFVGDSLVNGTGDRQMLGWTGRVCTVANHPDFIVTQYNLGIRGNTSEEILSRWKSEFELRKTDLADCRLVFSFGVNDTVIEKGKPRVSEAASLRNARAIMADASAMARLFWVGPTPVDDDEQNRRICKLSNNYEILAKELNIDYLSVCTFLMNSNVWKEEVKNGDGSHPDSSGYAVLSEYILQSPQWWTFTGTD